MGIERTFHRFEGWLEGWPSGMLSLALLVAAAALVLIALRGSPMEKSIALAYTIFP